MLHLDFYTKLALWVLVAQDQRTHSGRRILISKQNASCMSFLNKRDAESWGTHEPLKWGAKVFALQHFLQNPGLRCCERLVSASWEARERLLTSSWETREKLVRGSWEARQNGICMLILNKADAASWFLNKTDPACYFKRNGRCILISNQNKRRNLIF